MDFFGIIAVPLGYLMRWIYQLIPEYFLALFVFTLVCRLLMFPLHLKQQKGQADRARLQPRLDRLQKKYGQDPRKLQQKQQELYEKEGVSQFAGCLPSLVSMVLLFGVIGVIYKPLTYLHQVPTEVITACQEAVTLQEVPKDATAEEKAAIEAVNKNKVDKQQLQGYYGELRMMDLLEKNKDDALAKLEKLKLDDKELGDEGAQQYYDMILDAKGDFVYGDLSLLNQPWDAEKAFGGINLLWLIPLLSGLTAFGSTLLSMHYNKALTARSDGTKVPGQGCTSGMMYVMPLFSVYIAFVVPCGVGIYWIFSNLLALAQSFVLNKIYNPAKIRAQAEAEYQERRRKKAEEKRRLAESRRREQQENAKAANEEKEVEKKPKEKKLTAAQRNALAEKAAEATVEEAAEEVAPAEEAVAETVDNSEEG